MFFKKIIMDNFLLSKKIMDKELLKAFGFEIDKDGNAIIDMPFVSVPDGK